MDDAFAANVARLAAHGVDEASCSTCGRLPSLVWLCLVDGGMSCLHN